MDMGLAGKVAIVTGSGDGIGYATARALAQEGARVVLCSRREAPLIQARDAIARETGAELLTVPCDANSWRTSSDWSERLSSDSAPSI